MRTTYQFNIKYKKNKFDKTYQQKRVFRTDYNNLHVSEIQFILMRDMYRMCYSVIVDSYKILTDEELEEVFKQSGGVYKNEL